MKEIQIIWSTHDVMALRPELTEEQGDKVLDRVLAKHDANIGVNWEVLSIIANILYPEKNDL